LIVGTVEIDLNLPGVNSLKEKRQIVRSLLARLRNKFNVSVAEVEYNDVLRSARLGAAVVTNEKKYADQVIAAVIRHIESTPEVVLLDYQVELL